METRICRVCGNEFAVRFHSDKASCCGRACVKKAMCGHRTTDAWRRLGNIYRGMLNRCHNKKSHSYKYYGERGIFVCQEWIDSFKAFHDWSLQNGYSPDREIDRKDVNSGYSPDNCRWATRTEQMRNTRKRKNAITSPYRGVSWCSNVGKWRVQVCSPKRKSNHVGLFENEIEAAKAYDRVALEEFGEFASLNFQGKEKQPF